MNLARPPAYDWQHLHALADALFPKESQKAEKEAWTHRLLKNLKTWGPKTLMDAIAVPPQSPRTQGIPPPRLSLQMRLPSSLCLSL